MSKIKKSNPKNGVKLEYFKRERRFSRGKSPVKGWVNPATIQVDHSSPSPGE